MMKIAMTKHPIMFFKVATQGLLIISLLACGGGGGGGSSSNNSSSSSSGIVNDTTPNAFSFTPQTDVELNTEIESNTISISGINTPAVISITGGEYSIDNGAFTSVSGTVTNGQSITVRLQSSANLAASSTATLTIGGVNAIFTATTRSALATPELTLTPQRIKNFRFTWTDITGETEYRLLEDASGSAGYTQIATIPADTESYELEVFLPSRVNARYTLQACKANDCFPSEAIMVSGTLAGAVGYLKTSNSDPDDRIAEVIALSGDGKTLAVSARGEDSAATGINGDQTDNSANVSGAVYVFTRSAVGTWVQQAYLKASNAEAIDQFGDALALSGDGNTLAVGVEFEDSAATGINGNETDNLAADSGAVYIFTRNVGTWSQQAYIKASNTQTNDHFGGDLALSSDGNTLAVGATLEDSAATGINNNANDNSASASGAVYVFTRNISTWAQQAYVKASNTEAGDQFGGTVALSGDGKTLAVGTGNEDSAATGVNGDQNDNSAASSGAVYIFVLPTAGNWIQQDYVKASNTEAGDQFGGFIAGIALSNDGNTLAVGARSEASAATGVNGDQSDNSVPNRGAVYVFTRNIGTWSQQAYVKSSNNGGNFFGRLTLSGDGNLLAVSATVEGSAATGINGNQSDNSATSSGAVYVFTRSASTWTQQTYLKASNTGSGDSFGSSIALSGDGNILAVGAPLEDSAARGINGDQSDNSSISSGAVYLY